MSTFVEHGRAVQFWVHIPIPRVATEPYPPPDFLAAYYYPLSTAVGRSGRSGPPLCGGTPPATPPCSNAAVLTLPQLVCQRPGDNATVPARNQPVCQSQRGYATVPAQFQLVANAPRTRRQRACAAPAVRITNHKSRVTAVLDGRAVPALPCAGGHPPQRPPVAMPSCVRDSSLCISASKGDTTMPPRFQLAAGAPAVPMRPYVRLASRSRVRPSPSAPRQFLATGSWQLATEHPWPGFPA